MELIPTSDRHEITKTKYRSSTHYGKAQRYPIRGGTATTSGCCLVRALRFADLDDRLSNLPASAHKNEFLRKKVHTYPFCEKTLVKAKSQLLLAICCFPLATFAQTPTVIPLASEPHHHLALHNKYVNVYEVEVAPHDSVQLHRHEFDAISIMMSNSEVVVRAPGKPDVRQKLSEGQVRLQSSGYVHSTKIEGETTYRNVTVELLSRQQGGRNLCAKVIATQGLNCPSEQASPPSSTHLEQPQYETDQTSVTLIRVPPHQNITSGNTGRSELIVLLDDASVATAGETGPGNPLRPGDFRWTEIGHAATVFKNNSDKEARLISFRLKPQGSVETTPAPTK